jgi:hypothetical protein
MLQPSNFRGDCLQSAYWGVPQRGLSEQRIDQSSIGDLLPRLQSMILRSFNRVTETSLPTYKYVGDDGSQKNTVSTRDYVASGAWDAATVRAIGAILLNSDKSADSNTLYEVRQMLSESEVNKNVGIGALQLALTLVYYNNSVVLSDVLRTAKSLYFFADTIFPQWGVKYKPNSTFAEDFDSPGVIRSYIPAPNGFQAARDSAVDTCYIPVVAEKRSIAPFVFGGIFIATAVTVFVMSRK